MITLIILAGCSSSKERNDSSSIQVDRNVVVISEKGKWEVKKGETISIFPQESLFVQAPGYVGVLIIPMEKKFKGNLQLTEVSEKEISEILQKKQNIKLSEILRNITLAQDLIFKKKAVEALKIVDKLLDENRELVYLNFLKASCHVILGNTDTAKKLLEETLSIYPDFKEAIELYGLIIPRGQPNPFLKKMSGDRL
jgi:tetratricopeptide (TPR) repeat protein